MYTTVKCDYRKGVDHTDSNVLTQKYASLNSRLADRVVDRVYLNKPTGESKYINRTKYMLHELVRRKENGEYIQRKPQIYKIEQ